MSTECEAKQWCCGEEEKTHDNMEVALIGWSPQEVAMVGAISNGQDAHCPVDHDVD